MSCDQENDDGDFGCENEEGTLSDLFFGGSTSIEAQPQKIFSQYKIADQDVSN